VFAIDCDRLVHLALNYPGPSGLTVLGRHQLPEWLDGKKGVFG
jgi:hypothetical protein